MGGPAVIGPGRREPQPRPLLRATLGDVLRRTRLQQRRTLADVARAARVSMPYLSELERGRKEASSEVLAAVCDALRMELSDLLAAAGRDLVGSRARRAQVVRLAAVRGHRVPPEAAVTPEAATQLDAATAPEAAIPAAATVTPEGTVQPQASRTAPPGATELADVTAPADVTDPADITALAEITAQPGLPIQVGGPPPGRGPGDVVCLLAA
jgi:transcriptional regulator with XRE-family HTH domain